MFTSVKHSSIYPLRTIGRVEKVSNGLVWLRFPAGEDVLCNLPQDKLPKSIRDNPLGEWVYARIDLGLALVAGIDNVPISQLKALKETKYPRWPGLAS